MAALRNKAIHSSKRQSHRGPDWSGIFEGSRHDNLMIHERLAIVVRHPFFTKIPLTFFFFFSFLDLTFAPPHDQLHNLFFFRAELLYSRVPSDTLQGILFPFPPSDFSFRRTSFHENISQFILSVNTQDVQGGEQPLFSQDKKIVLGVNGEIYNHKKLEEEIKECEVPSHQTLYIHIVVPRQNCSSVHSFPCYPAK